MNRVVLIGRLTKDPETRDSGGKKITRYTLAVDRRGKQDTADFISCVCFDKTAGFAEIYLHKGTKIAVTGRIQTGSYTNKDGQKIYTTDVVVDSHEFCESKQPAAESKKETDPNGFMKIPEGIDEELPFN